MTLAMKLQDVKWEGRQEGERNKLLADIKALMETLNLTADKAMEALKVPEKERSMYLKLLEQ